MADINDIVDSTQANKLDALVNSGSQPSTSAPAGDGSNFDQLTASHNDLLSQLHYGNLEAEQGIKDSGKSLAEVSEFGTVMRTPSEIASGQDFITGQPLVTRDGNSLASSLSRTSLGGIKSNATPTPNTFLTKSILSPLANRRDTRYDAMNARQPNDPMIADPISGIAPQNAKVIKPIKPVATPGVSSFATQPSKTLVYPGRQP